MTTASKQVWKTVGITTGVILIIGAIVLIVIQRRKNNREQEDTDFAPAKPSGSGASGGSSLNNQGFTTQEVKSMQSWLVTIATMWQNPVIVNAIQSSGGIDGKIGSGFNKALQEAIRVKYVTDIHDLYTKAKNTTLQI